MGEIHRQKKLTFSCKFEYMVLLGERNLLKLILFVVNVIN